MGPSGSGKTTLLNALAGQVPASKQLTLRGRIHINGVPQQKSSHAQGYVQQEDVFFSQLTVRLPLFAAYSPVHTASSLAITCIGCPPSSQQLLVAAVSNKHACVDRQWMGRACCTSGHLSSPGNCFGGLLMAQTRLKITGALFKAPYIATLSSPSCISAHQNVSALHSTSWRPGVLGWMQASWRDCHRAIN